jgi:tetratricopeptide (TPR) repeat protein
MYDPSWSVLQSHLWEEMKIERWTEKEGRKLAEIRNIAFDADSFLGTPLSVIAPAVEIKRHFDLLPTDRKAVLEALKVIKTHLGCFASFELASALTVPSGKFDRYAFTDITVRQGLWCKTDDSTAMLADGVDDFIRYDVSRGDANGLQAVLMRDEMSVKDREKYLFYLGHRFFRLGDLDRSLKCYDRSKDLKPTNPAPWFNRAQILTLLGKIMDAQKSYYKAKKLFKKHGNKTGIAATLHELGTIEQKRGNFPNAIEILNESIEKWREVSNDLGIAMELHHLGIIEMAKHNYPLAKKFYHLSLEKKRKVGARSEMAVTLYNLARIDVDEGDLPEAKLLCGESLEILKESGDIVGIRNALLLLSEIEYKKGNDVEAKKLYNQSLEITRNLNQSGRGTQKRSLTKRTTQTEDLDSHPPN